MKKLNKAIKLNNKLERLINKIKNDIQEHLSDDDWEIYINLSNVRPMISLWKEGAPPEVSMDFVVMPNLVVINELGCYTEDECREALLLLNAWLYGELHWTVKTVTIQNIKVIILIIYLIYRRI